MIIAVLLWYIFFPPKKIFLMYSRKWFTFLFLSSPLFTSPSLLPPANIFCMRTRACMHTSTMRISPNMSVYVMSRREKKSSFCNFFFQLSWAFSRFSVSLFRILFSSSWELVRSLLFLNLNLLRHSLFPLNVFFHKQEQIFMITFSPALPVWRVDLVICLTSFLFLPRFSVGNGIRFADTVVIQ